MIKRNIFIVVFSVLALNIFAQQPFTGIMQEPFREHVIEDAKRNIILQNRCGNRLSLLMYEDSTALEFVYKPNAYRRKDYRARNFSNRDVYTTLFSKFQLPRLKVSYIQEFDYDPFYSQLVTKTPFDAKNKLHFINIADENAFAIAAKAPLVLQFKPHHQFNIANGLITEHFNDRGENIISFICFEDFEENRLRKLDNGDYVLQIFENEVVIVGGESDNYQVDRVIKKLKGKSLDELVAMNERSLDNVLSKGAIDFNHPDYQRVIDLNRRIVYSGLDEGGACYGAINRIYYLIWVRDGAMTASLMARAGNPDMINIWAPFLLNNPSYVKRKAGKERSPEFLQIVGTRWTKDEDDGIFYAMLSLYTYFTHTGKLDLVNGQEYQNVVKALDNYLEKNWDASKDMIVSDTRGETPLRSNPYFGYDVVNGNFEKNTHHISEGKSVSKTASLYNQVNTYNILMMLQVLMDQRDEMPVFEKKYSSVLNTITQTINGQFYNKEQDCYYMGYNYYDDGTTGYENIDDNPWEYTWAVSLGPFFPDLPKAVKSARKVHQIWEADGDYGYCPWNTLSAMLYEYGMSSGDYQKMLQDEIKEAMMLTEKYPMPGALSEYRTHIESWRGLPFSAGSFLYSTASQMLKSLPFGLAVRASNNVDTITNFHFRISRINAYADGQGDAVEYCSINGRKVPYSLQIPETWLRQGNNRIEIKRTIQTNLFRLYASNIQLIDIDADEKQVVYSLSAAIPPQLVFNDLNDDYKINLVDRSGKPMKYEIESVPGTNKKLLKSDLKGEMKLFIKF